jgi:hypothetical protein
MHVFRVRVSQRTFHVVAASLEAAIEKATAAARKAGIVEVDVSAVRRLGKAVR